MNNNAEDSEIIAGIAFTPKEMQVIRELVSGKSYKAISEKISVLQKTQVSHKTIEQRIKNIMSKTGKNSKSDLIEFFNENGIFPGKTKFRRKRAIEIISKIIGVFLIAFGVFHIYQSGKTSVTVDIPEFHEIFLRRTELLVKINEILQSQKGIRSAVIVGGGGAGKTVLAREVLRSSKCPVKGEVNAETSNGIYNSFFDLASHLATTEKFQKELEIIKDLTGTEEKRKRLIKLTSKLLRESGNWCLLFDNLDSMKCVKQYLPHSTEYWGNGTVIITTRNEDIQNVSSIKSSSILNVGLLTEEEQLKLFCDIVYGSEFWKLDKKLQLRIKNFLANIPKMPLDVCATAYYLKNTKISLEDYERIMRTSVKDLNEAQGVLLEENVNYSRTRYSIISSVFGEILKENPKLKMLLLVMCLLDSQNIPKNLIRMCADSIAADKFIYDLRKNSLITDGKDDFSIHRSSQSIGLDYIVSILTVEEKKQMLENLISVLTPYEKLETMSGNLMKLIPHLEAFLGKLSNLGFQDSIIEKSKIDLLIAIGSIHRYKAYRIDDSLGYFRKALELNKKCNYLDQTAVASINLKIGEIYTLMSANNEAMSYLEKSLNSLRGNLVELAKNYRLIGIMHMRKDHFEEANKYFKKAIAVLDQEPIDNDQIRERKSNVYADMAFNYAMNGINRNDAPKAIEIMKKAIEILSTAKIDPDSKSYEKNRGRLVIHMSRLAGIYNALGKYDPALKTAREAEDIIVKSGATDTDIVYAQGIIARERGLAHLRLNRVQEACDYFLLAKKIFSKSKVGAYLFRLKMHEAESLIRLDRLEEAFKACESMFNTKDRERNNYCDLFFNTCYYHAAVIKYRRKDEQSARKYFGEFFKSMRILCKNILSKTKYEELIQQNAFEENPSDMKICFENSLRVFEAIYWKDYEFTKYYVEENLKLAE
jgi:tetratricopeptide (TPR) repeat protein/DNA-binding CsgD family transcriptional regulator